MGPALVQGPLDGHCELPRARDVLLAASAAVRVASATFYSRVRADDDMRAHSVNLLRALSLIASATVYGYYERVYGVSPVCEIFFTSERCSQELDFISTIPVIEKFLKEYYLVNLSFMSNPLGAILENTEYAMVLIQYAFSGTPPPDWGLSEGRGEDAT